VRAALSIPRRTARSERLATAALGGLAAATALFAVGALSGWLLGVADASRPAMRLAAGSLLLLSAGVDLSTKPHEDLPSLPGIRAALVPIAVPLIARPAMMIAGLSIVADHGLDLYATALAIVVAALTVNVIAPPETDARRSIHVWVGRLFSAIAIAGSIVLIADAVFDI
jgi:small neutral amino acid transporter SnatA (MarC family)